MQLSLLHKQHVSGSGVIVFTVYGGCDSREASALKPISGESEK